MTVNTPTVMYTRSLAAVEHNSSLGMAARQPLNHGQQDLPGHSLDMPWSAATNAQDVIM